MANNQVTLIPGTSTLDTDIETLIRSDEKVKIAAEYIAACEYPDKKVLSVILGIN